MLCESGYNLLATHAFGRDVLTFHDKHSFQVGVSAIRLNSQASRNGLLIKMHGLCNADLFLS